MMEPGGFRLASSSLYSLNCRSAVGGTSLLYVLIAPPLANAETSKLRAELAYRIEQLAEKDEIIAELREQIATGNTFAPGCQYYRCFRRRLSRPTPCTPTVTPNPLPWPPQTPGKLHSISHGHPCCFMWVVS